MGTAQGEEKMSKFKFISLAASIAFALAFTISCSSGGDDNGSNDGNGNGSGGEGQIKIFGIKDLGESSFTVVRKDSYCYPGNGEWEEETHEYPTSYSLNGTTLSFGGLEFSGNSASIIGTWNSLSLGELKFNIMGGGTLNYRNVSKAVFTQNSLFITTCVGIAGEEREIKDDDGVVKKRVIIACGTYEDIVGTEKVRINYSGTDITATYKGKTCGINYSESKMRTACTEAYNKAVAEGYTDFDELEDYYRDILHNLHKDIYDCMKDFPAWFNP
jgi:uncharacterized lipoprotein YehR (DUF1307 family)